MFQRVLLLMFVLFNAVYGSVEYGGIYLECGNNCGISDYDAKARKIAFEFLKYICDEFPTDCYLYNQDKKWRSVSPYSVCSYELNWDEISFFRYDREKTGGIYMEEKGDLDSKYFKEEMVKFSHSGLLQAYERINADLLFYQDKQIQFYKRKLALRQQKLSLCESYKSQGYTHLIFDEDTLKTIGAIDINTVPRIDRDGNYKSLFIEICQQKEAIADIEAELNKNSFQISINRLEKTFREIDGMLKEWFLHCLNFHQLEGISFNQAIEALLVGDYFSAIKCIRTLIDVLEDQQFDAKSISKVYLLKGQLQAEVNLHADAILSLTNAIVKNPAFKEAYFERAVSYFEMGNFEKALDDYLKSGFKKRSSLELTSLALGLGRGIVDSAKLEVAEFIPSILNSVHGIGHGLWAFCSDPNSAVGDVVSTAIACVEYLKKTTILEVAQEMVPELRELVQNYDTLGDYEKGVLIGTVIGRYGVDIFLAGGTVKAVKYCRNLKHANQVATMQALASSKDAQRILEEAGKRWVSREETLKNANLKIHKGKQEKHIKGKKNFEPGKSIFEHNDPERLVRDYAGTGIKDPLHSKISPGSAGYKEIVDFGEKIGMSVNEFTGLETPTNWGKIHYAKDGVHIVPTFPPIIE